MKTKSIFGAVICAVMLAGFTACEGVMSDFDKEALKQEILDELREELKGDENQGNESEGENPVEDNNPDDLTDNSKDVNGHNAVDLGLPSGTLWATCNVGATVPYGYGDYFAWGEIETKENYVWETYIQNKYNDTDKKVFLDACDDVATVKWGGIWRMPTSMEVKELYDECRITWKTYNDVNGAEFVGVNGNSIFLPAAGCNDGSSYTPSRISNVGESLAYWTSKHDLTTYSTHAYYLNMNSGNLCYSGGSAWLRNNGLSVRPVCSGK